MICRTCLNENGLLIRGACATCNPALYDQHQQMIEQMARLDAAFYSATGKHSLEDWGEFERFLEAGAGEELAGMMREGHAER